MNCKKCGNALAPTDAFCPKCGEPITVEVQNVAPAPTPAGMTFITPPSTEPTNNSNAQTITPIQEPTPNVTPAATELTSTPMQEPSIANVVPPIINNEANIQQPTSVVPNIAPTPQELTVNPSVTPINQSLAATQAMPEQTKAAPDNINQMPQPTVVPEQPVESTKKKDSPVLVALLLIILIAVIAFIVIYLTKPFDKSNNTTDNNTINQDVVDQKSNNDNTENTSYTSWMKYLLDQNITAITLERTTSDGSGDKKTDLTKEQLSNIFSELSNYKLIKYYMEGSGFTFGDILTISYSVDDNNYEIKLANGTLWADDASLKDEGLRNALEESEHTTENEELKDKEGAFYNFKFDSYSSTILDDFLVEEKQEETE